MLHRVLNTLPQTGPGRREESLPRGTVIEKDYEHKVATMALSRKAPSSKHLNCLSEKLPFKETCAFRRL